MFLKKLTFGLTAACVATAGLMSGALAQDDERYVGMPHDGGIDFQEPVTSLGREALWFNNGFLLPIITVITVFVLLLLVIVVFKFRASKNPVPSKTTHNTTLEVIWTGLPILILGAIAAFSFPLLYLQDVIPETEFTIRATGNQWNWTYDYPDHDGINFTAVVVPNEAFENAAGGETFDPAMRAEYTAALSQFIGRDVKLNARLLDTDLRLVVPVNTKIQMQITASDVIHSWTVPAFGVKVDAVPGRLNTLWFEVDRIGTYYGQCSELCGKDHAYMPIAVEVVTKAEFAQWVERIKADYADAGTINYAGAVSPALGR